jgi:hypothetical protein
MIIKDLFCEIDLSKISFVRTSYREYFGIWKVNSEGTWLVVSYPFAIKLILAQKIQFDRDFFYQISRSQPNIKFNYHHQDRGKIGIDPCDIYEFISGIKIHHGESDSEHMKTDSNYYENNIRKLKKFNRMMSLEKLGI